MRIGWARLTCAPDADAIAVLRQSWAWKLPQPWTPLLFSVLGDVFLEQDSGFVFWLDTGAGELVQVAGDAAEFRAALVTEKTDEWFMPQLVTRLRRAGKIAGPGRCYTYAIFPVFAEGTYDVGNLNVVPAREHFGLSGELHARIAGLSDGQKVRIAVVP